MDPGFEDKVLFRNSDVYVTWDVQGRMWLNSYEAEGRICVPPQIVYFLHAFDGRNKVRDVLRAFGPSFDRGDSVVRQLFEAKFLVEAGAVSSYFRGYTFGSHHNMLRDAPRMRAFRDAIHEVVGEGSVVVDLGTGTGVLSLFACQSGARKVYAIDRSTWIDAARDMARANGYAERIEFIHERAERIELPEKADLLVSEWMDTFLVQERMFVDVLQARDRFLAPGGRMMPSEAAMFLTPMEHPELHGEWVSCWNGQMGEDYGLDFSVLRGVASTNSPRQQVSAASLLADPGCIFRMDMATAPPVSFQCECDLTFSINRSGTLHGFVGHFDVQLSPKVTLSTAPGLPETHWKNQIFLVPELEVRPGDELACSVRAAESQTHTRLLDVCLDYRLLRDGVLAHEGSALYKEV